MSIKWSSSIAEIYKNLTGEELSAEILAEWEKEAENDPKNKEIIYRSRKLGHVIATDVASVVLKSVEFPSGVYRYKIDRRPIMTNEDIENIFTYHKPIKDQPERYVKLREKAKELAYLINETCPDSREKSLAFTNLQLCIMMANASIAIHETEL